MQMASSLPPRLGHTPESWRVPVGTHLLDDSAVQLMENVSSRGQGQSMASLDVLGGRQVTAARSCSLGQPQVVTEAKAPHTERSQQAFTCERSFPSDEGTIQAHLWA